MLIFWYRGRNREPNYVINVTNQANKANFTRFGSPGLLNQTNRKAPGNDTGVYFMGEMKKHGIYDALNDINKFSEFFESLPHKEQAQTNESLKAHEQSSSSNNFTESESTQMMSSSGFHDTKDNSQLDPKREEQKARYEEKENNKKSHFLFPFQRRARSHSPPSEEQIHNKIAETINNNTKYEKQRSWSKSLDNNNNNANNKQASPVVANTSFMIGGADFHKSKRLGDRTRKGIALGEKLNYKGKEVEDWLYNNEKNLAKGELGLDGFLDDKDIISRVSANLG